jgi:hypothetical protein
MYELRIDGQPIAIYTHQAKALSRVREIARSHTDAEIEVMDIRTGRASWVAASVEWRSEIAARIR